MIEASLKEYIHSILKIDRTKSFWDYFQSRKKKGARNYNTHHEMV